MDNSENDSVYCLGISLVAGLLSLLGIIIFSNVWPVISLKLDEMRSKAEKMKLETKVPTKLQLTPTPRSSEEKGPVLNATLALAETSQSTIYYKLLCPVYIAKSDLQGELDAKVKKEPITVKPEPVLPETEFMNAPDQKDTTKEKKSTLKSKPRPKKTTNNRSKRVKTSKRKTKTRKSKQLSSSSDTTSSTSSSN